MNNNINKKHRVEEINQSVRQSFSHVLKNVREQIELECFSPGTQPQANEIALIMAEVMIMPSRSTIRIESEDKPADVVQAIFGSITHEHIELVLDKFSKITYPIFNKKAYLRTALYNSVFEFESHYTNLVEVSRNDS